MKKERVVKLNLGVQPQEGFDKASFDIHKFPWPLKNESVDEMVIPMVLNYIAANVRGVFMDEVWRVLKLKAKVTVSVPYYTSMRAVQDYAAEWPPFCEVSFMYFNRDWRKVNHPERNLKGNFSFGAVSYQAEPETALKNDETRSFWIKRYHNAVNDLVIVLTKEP